MEHGCCAFHIKLLQTNDSNDVLALYAVIAYYTVFASIWMEYAIIMLLVKLLSKEAKMKQALESNHVGS